MEIKQNTLYLTVNGAYVSRDHFTLKVEVERETKLTVPIHHLESVCVFGQTTVTPHALQLCWEHGVAVNYFSESGWLLGRWESTPNMSVMLRRAQYRAADNDLQSVGIARQMVAGKLQNARQSLLRSAREATDEAEALRLRSCSDEISKLMVSLQRGAAGEERHTVNQIRGYEGQAASLYFDVFSLHLRQQREDFAFTGRTKRPPRDAINCLLSFLYALVRHDCIAALTATGLDPFVGFLHTERPARPALALDLMEEFRTLLADRLAITLINRRQITAGEFIERDGGVIEFTPAGRKTVITAWQTRKQETVRHPLLEQDFRIGQLMLAQARILARHLRGDLPDYLPCVLK